MPMSINRWAAHPYYFLNGELDPRVIRALTKEMSYFVQGAERSKKFKEGRWDGMDCLFYKTKKGTYFFPCGMLDCVKRVFSDFEIEYFVQDIKLDDVRKRYKPLDLTWTGHTLYDYQDRSVKEIQANEGGVICLPTGAGKTLVMERLIFEYSLPTLIVVHTKELLYQWEKNTKAYLNGVCPGLVGDGYSNFSPITIGMMQTLSQKITKEHIALDYPIIMFDEVHRCPADTAYMVSMACNAPVRIGASATPTRTDGCEKKIFAAFGEIKSRITADELIKRGLLAKPEFLFLTPPTIYISKRSHWSDAYLQGIVINEGRNDIIAKKAIEYAKQGLTVYIHVERIDHGEILIGKIPGAVFLSGRDGTTKRQSILKKFAKGELLVLVSTLLKEGADIPGINVFIAAGGFKSPIGVIQKAGRALRIAPGKDSAIIIDFRDSGRYMADHFQDRYNAYKETFGEYVPDLR